MLSDLACGCEVYLVTGYMDMRKGIDGLATIVQGKLSKDPFSRSLYLFCGRKRSKDFLCSRGVILGLHSLRLLGSCKKKVL